MKKFVFDHNLSPNLARALAKAKLTAFFLLEAWSRDDAVRGPEIASRLLKLWPEISRLAHTNPRGTCFAVPFKGKIRRFHPQGKRPI